MNNIFLIPPLTVN